MDKVGSDYGYSYSTWTQIKVTVRLEELDRLAGVFNASSLERAPEGYLNHLELRFQNECARHKLLDLIGDFSLVGMPIKGKVIAYKSGHRINTEVAKVIRKLVLEN